jgi:juvenile hormone acid methyltransferase
MDNAKLYSKHNGEQTQSAKKFFTFFGEFLRKKFGENSVEIIDIGTGCGRVLVEIFLTESQLNFSQVVGVDKSQAMVDLAVKKYGNDYISFDLMDIEGSVPKPLKISQFDIVSSFYCLHWTQDLTAAFEKINNFLKPNGIFCCVFISTHILIDIWNELVDKYSPYMDSWKSNFNDICFLKNADEIIKKMLHDSGIDIIEFIDEKNDMFDFGTKEFFTGNFFCKFLF